MESTEAPKVKCPSCNKTLSTTVIIDHQRCHNALKTLKYEQVGVRQLSLEKVIQARGIVVKKLLSHFKNRLDHPELAKKLKRVNEAFDIVRSELNRGKSICTTLSPFIEKVREKDGGYSINEEAILEDIQSKGVSMDLPKCAVAIGTCCAQNIAYKNVMEDRTSIQTKFVSFDKEEKTKGSSCFLGLYDGYSGATAAERAKQTMHQLVQVEIEKEMSSQTIYSPKLSKIEARKLLNNLPTNFSLTSNEEEVPEEKDEKSTTHSSTKVLRCCQRAYKNMDQNLALGINETSRVRWSGCSATTIIIADDKEEPPKATTTAEDKKFESDSHSARGKLFICNVGNVDAYLSHNNKPYRLTQQHTINNKSEKKRVEEAGGKVVGKNNCWTINGVLATTRGLGNHGDSDLRKCVIFDPATATAQITLDTQFLVMASPSVWSLFDANKVLYIINNTPRSELVVQNVNLVEKPSLQEVEEEDEKEEEKENDEEEEEKEEEKQEEKEEGEHALADDVFLPDSIDVDVPSVSHSEASSDGIEEVVIVNRERADYDDNEESEGDQAPSEVVEELPSNAEKLPSNGEKLPSDGDSKEPELKYNQDPPIVRSQFLSPDRLAQAMSERLVRAALAAGSKENVSAIVVLFKGFSL